MADYETFYKLYCSAHKGVNKEKQPDEN